MTPFSLLRRSWSFSSILLLGLTLQTPISSQAATSYLMLQGQFVAGGAVETYQWRVDYAGSTLLTGQDLLDAVFGDPILVSGASYMAGNTSSGVKYTFFSSFGFSPQQFFAQGNAGPLTPVIFDGNYWAYHNAGGGYYDQSGFAFPQNDAYADLAWTEGATGSRDRTLADRDGDGTLNEASYDAWVFGAFGTNPLVLPTSAAFAGATVLSLVPEPGRALLLMVGLLGCLLQRRRAHRAWSKHS